MVIQRDIYYSAFTRIDSSSIGHGVVNRKNVVLSERSRPQKTTNHMITFTMRCPDQAKPLSQEAERFCQGRRRDGECLVGGELLFG